MIKILLLVMDARKANIDALYQSIVDISDCKVVYLNSQEQDDLEGSLSQYDFSSYDYVLAILRSKKMMQQHRFFARMKNLVFVEYDAWLNFYPNKYKGKFSNLYRKTNPELIVSSGYGVSEKLKKEGFEVEFVPKGYDHALLKNLNLPRDIKYGFIGSVKNQFYAKRVEFISKAEKAFGLISFQTESGNDYLQGLNRIDFFISADIGFGEYMIKNFEAMACGCVLFAFDQGAEENAALGFKDMENVVLYSTVDDLSQKIRALEDNPQLAESIRRSGQQLAEEGFRYDLIAKKIIELLEIRKANGYRMTSEPSRGLFKKLIAGLLGSGH